MSLFYLLLHVITVVMFSSFVANAVKTKWDNLIKQALRTVLRSKVTMKQTFLTRMGSVNLESSRVQNMLITP